MSKQAAWRIFAIPLMLLLTAALVGCSDSDDDPEVQTSGLLIEGDPGVAIPIPENPDDVVALNAVLDLDNTLSYNASSGKVSLHFLLTDEDGNGISLPENTCSFRAYASQLVNNTDPEDPGLRWQQVLSERANSITNEDISGLLVVHDGNTGDYTYTFADEGGVLATALNNAVNTDVFRVTFRTRCRTPDRIYIVNPVNASYDFEAGTPSTRLTAGSGADLASSAACNSCHGRSIGGVGHGGGYTEVKTCINCHNLDYMAERNAGEADLAHMVHKIHSAGAFDQLLDRNDNPVEFLELGYPEHLFNCAKCHNNDASDAADFNLAFTNPTRKNCGSCHDDVDFEAGTNHGGNIQTDDTNCTSCHLPGGVTLNAGTPDEVVIPGTTHTHITVYNPPHFEPDEIVNDPRNTPEFDVTIAMEAPANGTHYVAGETPLITVTLADHATGDPVPGTYYTGTPSADGVAPGGGNGLSVANLYVYGPRSQAVPVLTTDSTTDGGARQSHSLLSDSTDPQASATGTGYTYELLDQIDQLQPGTYMVRFEGEGYGVVDENDFVTASTALITFQVGQAEEEPKVAGDACVGCHGDTRMHLSGAHPHNEAFDTDGCLACHDTSVVNYGDYLANRVHAIHSASQYGDLGPAGNRLRDWSHITFPQDPNNCTICHTNLDAQTPVWRSTSPVACAGCHGADADPSLGDDAIAASHMIAMGATSKFLANGHLAISEEPFPVPGCLVCHGEGQDFDLFVKHNLVDYSVPLESDEQL